MRPWAVVVLLVVLALAAPARAADVRVVTTCSDDRGRDCRQTAVFRAAAGERNDVTVTGEDAVALFRDAGAPVTPGPRCVAVDAHTAHCSAAPPDEILFTLTKLGDGDDLGSDLSGVMDGGAGDDRLTGGIVTGGPGSDVLIAGPHGAGFADGDGARPAPDRYVGGPGDDGLYYGDRRRGVTVNLRSGRAGAPGEGDVVTDVDSATGGRGDDVLIGTGAANTLIGGRGGDRLVGRGGADKIVTSEDYGVARRERGEPDVVRAGPGGDQITVTSDHGDRGNRIDCGPGHDRVDQTQRRDLLARCEALTVGDTLQSDVRLRAVLPRPRVAFLVDLRCYCRGSRYVARAHGQPVARARGGRRRVALRLNPLGRRLLAARGRLPVTVEFRERYSYGVEVYGFRTVLRLRPPAPAAGSSCPACRRAGRR